MDNNINQNYNNRDDYLHYNDDYMYFNDDYIYYNDEVDDVYSNRYDYNYDRRYDNRYDRSRDFYNPMRYYRYPYWSSRRSLTTPTPPRTGLALLRHPALHFIIYNNSYFPHLIQIYLHASLLLVMDIT